MTKHEIMKKLNAKLVDKVPPEWKTMAQLSKQWDMSPAGTSSIVRRALKAGLAVARVFRVSTTSRVFGMPHYRFKKGGAD